MNLQTPLKERLDSYPRLAFAEYPTPLEFLPRLSAELDRPVYVKRDDEIGPGGGGNKTRKLEYLMAEALECGMRKVVTFGGLQSNHARLTAAAARRCGLKAHLFYFERRPKRLAGNLLLNQVLGARMHFIPLGESGSGMTVETTSRLVHWLARLQVGRHYFIPVGGHSWRGCLGYVRAAWEIDEQARQLGIQQACIGLAAGSGGTLAGMMAGLTLIDSPLRLLGIDVGKLWKAFPASIARLANELIAHLSVEPAPPPFRPEEVPMIEETYVGERYGVPSPLGMETLRRLARLEGLLLDPVYTAKAFSGLLDWAALSGERGATQAKFLPGLEPGQPLIFLHTGGLPALFAFEGLR